MRANFFYRSRPGMSGLFVVLWRTLCFSSIILFIFLFDDMPGISVMAIFGFFASLVAISRGSISVAEDRFIVENRRLIPGLADHEEMPFGDIAEIEARLSFFRQHLRITYEDGTVSAVSLFMDRAMVGEALQCIRKQSSIRVEFVGPEVFQKMIEPQVGQEAAGASS
ncbi:MAG TPA: hypothetical protein VHE54_15675 [Puia sp.]|nr:hypothetical protein [Puia sp.]